MNLDNMRDALQAIEKAQALVEDEDMTSLQKYLADAHRVCHERLGHEESKLLVNIFKREGKL